ncbi:hypothetical protein LshimejAT787_0310390 [Lyophyllum shimeji]|uniref:Transmembrane protein n=1 Tax=Lyophyllum shimeji TaxID=47721 RepID=A0A9P3PK19_LYOSH|nr:hypothetical protein LshimejAT787_0310390 [Lyophyllum shimeji]
MILESFLVMALAGLAAARLPRQLDTRAFTSSAVCTSDFSWTDNAKGVSPCSLAAVVLGTCAGNSWNVQPLPDGKTHYTAPNVSSNTVNPCSCSWAAYNLISACTLCQGFEQSIMPWPAWIEECGDKVSTEYFPHRYTLPVDTAIPAYAGNNPAQWSDQRFNVQEARAIHDQGKPDITQTQLPNKSSTPVGAIVGGVIGGLAVVILGGLAAFFMYRRKHQRHTSAAATHGYGDALGHSRTMSDLSQKSTGIGFGYQPMERSFVTSPSTRPPVSPTSGTMHTHSSSVHSLSYFGSVNNSTAPYASPSPPPAARTLSPSPPLVHHGMNREDIIVPFTLPPSPQTVAQQASPPNLADRKRADGAIIPVYDSPNSLPSHIIQSGESSNDSPTPRRRLNPPAYSIVDTYSQAPASSRPVHSKKGSADTQHSLETTPAGATTIRPGSTTGNGSTIGAIDEIIEQLGLEHGQDSVSGSGGTLATGQSRQFSGNQPFRPVIGNPDA